MVLLGETQPGNIAATKISIPSAHVLLGSCTLQACDFFDEDLGSGYMRVLMAIAAGWSKPEIAEAVSAQVQGGSIFLPRRAASGPVVWLAEPVHRGGAGRAGGLPLLGAEAVVLLGWDESKTAWRPALRRIGELLRPLEEAPEPGEQ
jgi:hypothetical protein